jgi:hypothetical protein
MRFMRYVHDLIPEVEESGGLKHFSEEVGLILMSANEGHTDHVILHEFTDEEVTAFDMFHACMMFRVVSDVDCGLVVDEKIDRLGVLESEFANEAFEGDGFARSLGSGDYLCLTRRKSDALLLL